MVFDQYCAILRARELPEILPGALLHSAGDPKLTRLAGSGFWV